VREAVLPHLTSTDDIDNRLRFVELDLLDDKGWDEAMRGIDILIHTASPFPMVQPEDENNLIRPAVDGTLRALRAASKAGVERVILTSSVAAVIAAPLPGDRNTYNEDDWSDVTSPSCTPYLKSKTMAEQAAWKFARHRR